MHCTVIQDMIVLRVIAYLNKKIITDLKILEQQTSTSSQINLSKKKKKKIRTIVDRNFCHGFGQTPEIWQIKQFIKKYRNPFIDQLTISLIYKAVVFHYKFPKKFCRHLLKFLIISNFQLMSNQRKMIYPGLKKSEHQSK